MTDHLPECCIGEAVYAPPSSSHSGVPVDRGCICDRLRQAEQRGFHRGWQTAEAYWRKVSIRYGRRKVQECRDAVAALRSEYPGMTQGNVALEEAEVAIDALRGDPHV